MVKLTINPIGTCRINTPLKRGSARYPIRLDHRRIYGFVHTSEEALQQLRYRLGEITFPDAVLPVLFRPGDNAETAPPVHDGADLTIVEISSSKSCQMGGVSVQSNYLTRYFADFFGPARRARRVQIFWDLVRSGERDRLMAFLESDPVYRLYGAADRDLLSSLRVRGQSFDDVYADMAGMADRIGRDRMLFVTHVNGAGPDGGLIASRDKLIRWVRQAAERIGAPCFDPTELMREFGQDKALERGGLDLTHFTNAFSDRWFARVQREYMLPRIEGGIEEHGTDADAGSAADAEEQALLCDSIAAVIDHDDFFAGTRQLYAALRLHPENKGLHLLHGQLLSRLGDFEGAVRELEPLIQAPEMTPPVRRGLMRAMMETGEFAAALGLGRQLLADEYEDAEIFETAGTAAEKLDLAQEAVLYRKLAFRLDPSRHATARAVLDHYHATGEAEQRDAWLEEVLDAMDGAGQPGLARMLAEWAIATRHAQAAGRALIALGEHDMAIVPGMIEDVIAAEMQLAIAPAIAALAGMAEANERAQRALRAVASQWGETCQALLTEGRWREAHDVARACIAVTRNNGAARRVERAALDAMRAAVRAARDRGDHAEVVALCETAGDLAMQRRDVALAHAAALSALGRVAEAQDVLQHLTEASPDDVDARAMLAQLAASNGDFNTAIAVYGALADEGSPQAARYQQRIARFLGSAGGTGTRHVRTLVSEGRFAEAVAACRLMERYSAAPERATAELPRILSAMRARLRGLEEDEHDAAGEALELLQIMLSIAPREAVLLRRAALEAMKSQDFALALGFWQRLEQEAPGLDSTTRNIHRCELLLQRHARQQALRTRSRHAAI